MKNIVTLLIVFAACLLAVSCIQEPLDLPEFEDIGFGPYANQYDALVEMERIYGRTLITSVEIDGVLTTLELVVNEDNTVILDVTNGNGHERIEGSWKDWTKVLSRCDGWPEEGDCALVKQLGMSITFEGNEAGATGIVPSAFDSRIIFSYSMKNSVFRESENGRYHICSPKTGMQVDLKAMESDNYVLVQSLWIILD